MTPQQITEAIAADPALQALAAAHEHGQIAAALSIGRTRVEPRMCSARGLAERMSGGPLAAETVLLKLEGARDSMLASGDAGTRVMGSLLRRQLAFLGTDGLDFGSAALRAMLEHFQTLNILTSQEVAALKAIAETPDAVSVAEVIAAIGA